MLDVYGILVVRRCNQTNPQALLAHCNKNDLSYCQYERKNEDGTTRCCFSHALLASGILMCRPTSHCLLVR